MGDRAQMHHEVLRPLHCLDELETGLDQVFDLTWVISLTFCINVLVVRDLERLNQINDEIAQ